jgi:hypothetical protein
MSLYARVSLLGGSSHPGEWVSLKEAPTPTYVQKKKNEVHIAKKKQQMSSRGEGTRTGRSNKAQVFSFDTIFFQPLNAVKYLKMT